MYLSTQQIKLSLKQLESHQMFYGTTFLVFKKGELPVGETRVFPIDSEERKFLDLYYRPKKTSSYYYRPMRAGQKDKSWLDHKYPGAGSQSLRTRGKKAAAFIHETDTQIWGWQKGYIEILKSDLNKFGKIPLFHLAVWLYREKDWQEDVQVNLIAETFIDEYHLSKTEIEALFDPDISNLAEVIFTESRIMWEELENIIGPPPDADTGEGATLTYLELVEVGPASKIELIPSERLSLITGDNGLGKTFILECIWWALTGQWSSFPAYPKRVQGAIESTITFELSLRGKDPKRITSSFNKTTGTWQTPKSRPTIPGLLIYAKVDSSFSVWDPERIDIDIDRSNSRLSLVFSKDQVWNGYFQRYQGENRSLSEGLIRDWIKWQLHPKDPPFSIFSRVLKRLSPGDLGALAPGEPTIVGQDARQMPTIDHPYGTTPVIYAAAGIKRIIALAYFIVWSWTEHQRLSLANGKPPQRKMVILIDELEAHLHPRWQRLILPSLLEVSKDLSADLDIQFIIATHSPLVMASVEPYFKVNKDSLWHLNLAQGNLFESDVSLEELPFTIYGPSDSWLRSEVFDSTSPRSIEATQAITRARALQLERNPSAEAIREVSNLLRNLLAVDDEFWPIWLYFAEQYGVKL